MLPLNYDTPVIDELGKIHPLNEYAGGSGGDISDAIPIFTSDDTIQDPTEKVSMPLFQSGNALKDLLRWISKAMQNIRYLLKFTEDINTDLDTTIEKVDDINTNLVKEWTETSVALAGEYYLHNNLIWKALVDTATTPSEGSEWHNVKVMDEVSVLNSNFIRTRYENHIDNEYLFADINFVQVGDFVQFSLNDVTVKQISSSPIEILTNVPISSMSTTFRAFNADGEHLMNIFINANAHIMKIRFFKTAMNQGTVGTFQYLVTK